MASRGVNKVIIVGRLGDDPEIIELGDDSIMAKICVATSDVWTDKATGEAREKTEWHYVALFGRLAEIVEQYLFKGSQVYLEGQLQTRKWQDEEGNDRYTTGIVVQGYNGVLQMLGSAPQQQGIDSRQDNHHQVDGRQVDSRQAQNQPPAEKAPQQRNSQQRNTQQRSSQERNSQERSSQQRKPQQRTSQQRNSPQGTAPHETAPQYNEPPMDFDDDIPFAPVGLQYRALLRVI